MFPIFHNKSTEQSGMGPIAVVLSPGAEDDSGQADCGCHPMADNRNLH